MVEPLNPSRTVTGHLTWKEWRGRLGDVMSSEQSSFIFGRVGLGFQKLFEVFLRDDPINDKCFTGSVRQRGLRSYCRGPGKQFRHILPCHFHSRWSLVT